MRNFRKSVVDLKPNARRNLGLFNLKNCCYRVNADKPRIGFIYRFCRNFVRNCAGVKINDCIAGIHIVKILPMKCSVEKNDVSRYW